MAHKYLKLCVLIFLIGIANASEDIEKGLEKMKVSEETMKANDMIIFNIPENQSLDGKHGTLLELHADGKWLVQVLEEKDRQIRVFPARLIKLTETEKFKVLYPINDLVIIDGLKKTPSLNGKHGTVIEVVEGGKCDVQMLDEDRKYRLNCLHLTKGKLVKNLTDCSKIEYIISSIYLKDKLVVLNFSSLRCQPCHQIAPVFENIAKIYPEVVLIKLDAEQNQEAAKKCQITGVPAFQFYKNGYKVDGFAGANERALYEKVNFHK